MISLEKHQQLMDRLTENYNDYRANLLLKDRQELIDSASQIAGTADVFRCLTERAYTEQEVNYLLQFQNPLEVIADHWTNQEFLLDALDAVVIDVVEREADLALYPLAADISERRPEILRKFLNVDLEKILPQIMKQKTAFYQDDLQYALKDMRRGIATDDPAKRNFMVIFRESGVDCLNERDMFIAETRSYNTCQYYHKHTNEQVLAYSIELVGDGKKGLRGNLYQQDQHTIAKFTERAASLCTDITMKFNDGFEACVPQKDYYYEDIRDLNYQHGDIVETRNEAEDESRVQGALEREHARREDLPQGRIGNHLQNLEKQRIQEEADWLTSELQRLTEPNTPDKTHFMAKVSPYFLPLASEDDMHRLFEKVQGQIKRPMYIHRLDGKEGLYFFMRQEERTQECKPSIKAQLAAKPIPGNKPAQKSKEREVR